MIELSQHIENLLLENDCVVIPRLGGFIAHYQPATYVEEEGLFLPPTRVVGFNPQLRMNDGLLVQSFMDVYGTNFSDANRMIERKWTNYSSNCTKTAKPSYHKLVNCATPFTIKSVSLLTITN